VSNYLLRGALYVAPLLLIAFLAGAAGYFVAGGSDAPELAPLSPEEGQFSGVQGAVQGLDDDTLTILTGEGETLTLELPGESTVEVLRTVQLRNLNVGDWINGGAITHPDTVLALVGLVLITDPVIQGP
jgi:hypothetical protein